MEDDARKRDFDYFLKCLMEAGMKLEQHYFQLPVAGKEEPIFRERVYCYELYHQLRSILGDDFPYKLDGEVDKSGHPLIRQALRSSKPDFIVHIPGVMDKNLVVIEVKPITVKDNIGELEHDLEKLQCFVNDAKYYRAILLVYADDKFEQLPEPILSKAKEFTERCGGHLLTVWHPGFQKKPRIVF